MRHNFDTNADFDCQAAEDDTEEEKSLAQQLDKTKEELIKFKMGKIVMGCAFK